MASLPIVEYYIYESRHTLTRFNMCMLGHLTIQLGATKTAKKPFYEAKQGNLDFLDLLKVISNTGSTCKYVVTNITYVLI